MPEPIPDHWQLIAGGADENAEFYVAEPGIIVVVPHDGCTDNARSARRSLEVQTGRWRKVGRKGGAIVLMDPILHQDSGARRVYRDDADTSLITGFALVGGTAFGRAIASVFLGLSRPEVPTRMFATRDEAFAWLRVINADREDAP